MISSIAFIPKGAAKSVPDQAEIDEHDMEAMRAAAEAEAQASSGVSVAFYIIRRRHGFLFSSICQLLFF